MTVDPRPLPLDRVSFPYRGRREIGTVIAAHAKTATVAVEGCGRRRVPWALLSRVDAGPDNDRMHAIAARARVLLARHGLDSWSFALDGAKRRGGACHFGRRQISIAAGFAADAGPAEIEDTLLHEIAHALVGGQHHHDAVWQARARAIGCSARRCHTLTFAEPSVIARCANGCFAVGKHRRRRNMRCRRCGGAVVYEAIGARSAGTRSRFMAIENG